jgi:ubiquinone/menaquinone biosynthesis C-methylase UbiE
MDSPELAPDEHRAALSALNRINRLLGVDRRLFRAAGRLADSPLRSVADLGAGGGGFLCYVADRTRATPGRLMLALDRSWPALRWASEWSHTTLAGIVADARCLPLANGSIDVVTCSLFLHHFDPDGVAAILREAARIARRGVVVSDLARSRLSLVLTWLTTRVFSRSRVFRDDGPRSVRAAFTPAELAAIAARAGLGGAKVRRHFPFRMLLVWRTPTGRAGAEP